LVHDLRASPTPRWELVDPDRVTLNPRRLRARAETTRSG
jgi:hypothetical protein